jgi:hypothetical protein
MTGELRQGLSPTFSLSFSARSLLTLPHSGSKDAVSLPVSLSLRRLRLSPPLALQAVSAHKTTQVYGSGHPHLAPARTLTLVQYTDSDFGCVTDS